MFSLRRRDTLEAGKYNNIIHQTCSGCPQRACLIKTTAKKKEEEVAIKHTKNCHQIHVWHFFFHLILWLVAVSINPNRPLFISCCAENGASLPHSLTDERKRGNMNQLPCPKCTQTACSRWTGKVICRPFLCLHVSRRAP